MPRTNPDPEATNYMPNEATDHVFPVLRQTPDWFVIGGPGGGCEMQEVHKYYPNCRILAIEPSTAGFTAASNKLPPGAKLIRKALWSRTEELYLYYPNDLLHSTLDPLHINRNPDYDPIAQGDYESVGTTTVDLLDREYGPINNGLLWLDIEGSEYKALVGACGVLSRSDSFNTVVLEVLHDSATSLLTFLGGYGFKMDYVYLSCTNRFNGVWVR